MISGSLCGLVKGEEIYTRKLKLCTSSRSFGSLIFFVLFCFTFFEYGYA